MSLSPKAQRWLKGNSKHAPVFPSDFREPLNGQSHVNDVESPAKYDTDVLVLGQLTLNSMGPYSCGFFDVKKH